MGSPNSSLESLYTLAMIHPAINSLRIMIKLFLCINPSKSDVVLTCPLI
jgi:hypothetical protein